MRRYAVAMIVGLMLIVSACGEGATSPSTGGSSGAASAPAGSGAASVPASSDGAQPSAGGSLTFWTNEDNAERVAKTQTLVEKFTTATGIPVEVVAIAEDQLQSQITAASAAGDLPDVFGALSLGFTHSLAADGLADPAAAASVVDALGRDTFSPRALELVTAEGELAGVPSDSWAQLLVYRKDLFQAAGLEVPDDFASISAAATALNKDGTAGIVAATGAADAFTQQTFEYFALANGCQLTDDAGNVTLTSPACVKTFEFYTNLIKNGSVPGAQDADTTRAAYFAGDAAMIVWSSFLLDELAGLRNDALPTCEECRADKQFLAKNSGVVTAVSGENGSPSQFGELVSFVISADANVPAAQQFVEFMMSDGYVDWLALAPEGKFPARLGTAENPTEYADAWGTLEAGVDTKAPLGELYPPEVIETLTKSTDTMNRWGFPQGQGALVGPLLVELPVPAALAEALDGSATPEEAAADAQAAVEEIKNSIQ
jgi:multiple sugar transport system substrate-binding protein